MQLLEVLDITPDWRVELRLPQCELSLEGCASTPDCGIRVHGCAFHFACSNCAKAFRKRVSSGYKEFDKMRCTNCHIGYDKKTYFRIVKL